MLVVECDEAETEFRVCLPLHSLTNKLDEAYDWANGSGDGDLSQRAALNG